MNAKYKIRLFTFGLLATLSSVVPAKDSPKDVPFDFKGIVLGSRQSKIEHDIRFNCWDPKNPIADRICRLQPREKETIAGAPVNALLLYFYDEKLQTISIFFMDEKFLQVTAAFKEKYGQSTLRTEGIQTPAGAILENQIESWRRLNATLEVRHYSTNPGLASARFTTDDAVKGYEKRKEKTAKETAKDL